MNLNQTIYSIKDNLSRLSANAVKSLLYGYSCDKEAGEKIEVLRSFLTILEKRQRRLALGAEPCLDDKQLQSLVERVQIQHCTTGRTDLIVDSSGENAWIAKYPACVSRQKWERLTGNVFNSLKLKIKKEKEICDIKAKFFTEEEACDITFEITRELVPCDVLVALSVYKEVCDLGLKVSRTEEECKIDYELLLEETNCDIDYNFYKQLVECNLSYDIIKTVVENDCEFVVDSGTVLECCDNPPTLTLTCPPDAEYLCIENVPTVEVDILNSFAAGGCGEKIIEPIFEDGTGPCPWNITRIFQVTDECGSTANCQYSITVDDTGVPDSGCQSPCP